MHRLIQFINISYGYPMDNIIYKRITNSYPLNMHRLIVFIKISYNYPIDNRIYIRYPMVIVNEDLMDIACGYP